MKKSYLDKIYYDVIDIDTSHHIKEAIIFLGDDATNQGMNHVYIFYRNDYTFTWGPMNNKYFLIMRVRKKIGMLIDKNKILTNLDEKSKLFMIMKKLKVYMSFYRSYM